MTTAQLDLFAQPPAQRLSDREREGYAKDRCMELAAEKGEQWLAVFRQLARNNALANGGVTDIDQVRDAAERCRIDYEPGAWMGSLFRCKEWECIGWTPATHEGSHGRSIRRWRLRK